MAPKAPRSKSDERDGRTVLAVVSDLLIEVRVEAAARLQGLALRAVPADELVTQLGDSAIGLVVADLAVVRDLDAVTAAAQQAGVKVVAFYPHVDTELRKAAKNAGIDFLYPRSRFLRELPKILAARLQS